MSVKMKKSESIEIRIPYPTKEAYMAQCRANGVTASDALRASIERSLHPATGLRPESKKRASVRLIFGALLAATVGAMAAPSLARTNADAAFQRLDTNKDGQISRAEFRGGRSLWVVKAH